MAVLTPHQMRMIIIIECWLKELVICVMIDMFWDPNFWTLGLVVTHLEAYHTTFL
jgi:hypothetical protein